MHNNKILSYLKSNNKKISAILFGTISTLAVLTLIFTQMSFIQGLFSRKSNQNYAAKVLGVTENEDRSSQQIQDLIKSQDDKIVLAQSYENNTKKIQAENFKNSNVGNDDDKKRLQEAKTTESGEIILKVKSGQNIDLEKIKQNLKLDDVQIKPVDNTPGFYVLRSQLLKIEAENAWSKANPGDKKRISNPMVSGDLTPANSDVFKNLKNTGLFESISPNPIFTIDANTNDIFYSSQWYLNNNNLPKADINYPEAMDLGINCSNIKIAIIDTGVSYDHPDLKDRISGLTPEFPKGYNSIATSGNADDDHYHGTHVAGVVAAETNNSQGVSGICPGAKIIPIKVLDSSGGGSFSQIISGLNYAIDNGADVINMSLGALLPTNDPFYQGMIGEFQNAINKAKAKGVVVVVAAGNDASDIDDISSQIFVPAALDNVITVASSNRDETLSYFSNYGKNRVEISAPGEDIYSTITKNYYNNSNEVDSYDYLSGTSMASPVVAATVGAIKSKNPTLTQDQILEIIQNSSDKSLAYTPYTQSGRLNLAKTMVRATNPKATVYAFNDFVKTPAQTPIEIKLLENDLVPGTIFDYSLQFTQPKNGTLHSKGYNNTKTVIYTPNPEFSGIEDFSYVLSSRLGEKSTARISVNVTDPSSPPLANDAKVKVRNGDQTTLIDLAGLVKSIVPTGNIFIEQQPRTFNSFLRPSSKIGVYEYTNTNPKIKAGQTYYDQFAYSVLDVDGNRSNTAYVTLEITKGNFAPTYTGQTYYQVDKGAVVTVDVLAGSNDLDDDTISIKSAKLIEPYPGLGSTGSIAIVNQKLVYTADQNENYFYDFLEVVIADNKGAETTLEFNFTHIYVPPISSQIANNFEKSIYESTSFTIAANDLIGFSKYSCIDQEAEFSNLAISNQATAGNAKIIKKQDWDYCAYKYIDKYFIEYTVGDLTETTKTVDSFDYTYLGTGQSLQEAKITVNVFDPSHESEIKAKPNLPDVELIMKDFNNHDTLLLDKILQSPIPEIDPESFILTKSATNSGIYASYSYYNGKGINFSTYLPNMKVGDVINDSIEFTLSGPTTTTSKPIRLNIRITKVNSSPLPNDDTAIVSQGGSVLVDVLANDTDPDGDIVYIDNVTDTQKQPCNGKSRAYEIVTHNQKQYVKYTNISTNTAFQAVPAGEIDTCLYYTARDSTSVYSKNTHIDVYINSAPLISPLQILVSKDSETKLDLNQVVADHFQQWIFYSSGIPAPANNSEIDINSIAILNQPTSGNLSFDKVSEQFKFVPNNGVTQVNEKVQITVKDLWGESSTGFINLASTLKIDPVANDDIANVDEFNSINIDVLSNDTYSTGTLGANGTIKILGESKLGNATVSPNRKIVYTQNKEITLNSVDTILYTVTNVEGETSNIGTVTINIKDLKIPIPAPISKPDTFSILEADSQPLDLVKNDTFKNQDIFYLKDLIVTTQPQYGILEKDPKLGTLIYTQTQILDADLIDTFKYKLIDILDQSSNETTTTINIKNTNSTITSTNGQNLLLRNKADSTAKFWKFDPAGNKTTELNLVDSANKPVLIPSSLRLALQSDFDKDSKDDLIFENKTNGKIEVWYLSQNVVTKKVNLKNTLAVDYQISSDFQIISSQDFNQDGKMDLLVYNGKTGQQQIMYVDNNVVTSRSDILINGVAYRTRGWQIITSSDFNSDTKPDILFYNPATGEQIVWLLNNQNQISSQQIKVSGAPLKLPSNTGWKISTVGDFNGDGKPDLIWYNHINNRQMLYALNGVNTTLKSDLLEANKSVLLPANWSIAASGDFNKDGKSDLVLQNTTTGNTQIWLLNGQNIIARNQNTANNPGLNWQVQTVSN